MQKEMVAKQLRAIELIAQGLSEEKVATEIGVTSRTIRNWKNQKTFGAAVRERLMDVREAIQARFNPLIERIQQEANTCLDVLKDLVRSDNPSVALRAVSIHFQMLKWAGSADNRHRGSDLGVDAIVGATRTAQARIEDLLEYLEHGQPDMKRRRPAPATPETGPSAAPPETGKMRKDAMEREASPRLPGEAGLTPPATESGNNRKDEPVAAPAPLSVNGEGSGVGSGVGSHAAEKCGNAAAAPNGNEGPRGRPALHNEGGRGTPAPHNEGRRETPALHKKWREKGPQHVPFYRKFQTR